MTFQDFSFLIHEVAAPAFGFFGSKDTSSEKKDAAAR